MRFHSFASLRVSSNSLRVCYELRVMAVPPPPPVVPAPQEVEAGEISWVCEFKISLGSRESPSFLKIILCVGAFCLYVYLCTMCVPGA